MVKKLKKDDKTPVADVFDPILIESRQAATVTIMLDSPEEDVLIRACEAIFRFTDKAEENKRQLHELNATEKLIRLLQHPDKSVRRNASMAIGVMAEHPDVRRYLRKQEDIAGILISLLSSETEDRLTNEFSSLCTSRMAIEYTGKAMLANRNELFVSLIALLGNSDPDVQKNSIETIYLLIHDYKARAKLRDFDPWEAIVNLFDSEFPIIQQLALQTIQKIAEDGPNRSKLLEVGIISRLVDFIGNSVYSNMHVYAMQALANCMDDAAVVQLMRESGSLARLTAFVIDQQTTDEDKDDKRKKGTKSPKGKRDADSPPSSPVNPDKKNKKKDKGGEEQFVPTLPILKENAAIAIARCARQAPVRQLFHEQNIEVSMNTLLQRDEDKVQSAAAKAIAVMAEADVCRESFFKLETIPLLVKRCFSDFPNVRESATLALANLTNNHPRNCSAVDESVDLARIVSLLEEKSDHTVTSVLQICTNMAAVEPLRLKIESLGIISYILNCLRSHYNPIVLARGLLTTASYLIDADCRAEMRELGGCETLANLAASPDAEVLRMASLAIATLIADKAAAAELCAVGCVETLLQIQKSETRKNSFSQTALDELLRTTLPMKYALYGRLDANDIVTDGFYDAGPVVDVAQLATLESYCKAPINQRRPVLLINAVRPPPPPVTNLPPSQPTSDQGADEDRTISALSQAVQGKGEKTKSERGSKRTSAADRKVSKGQGKNKTQTGNNSPDLIQGGGTPEPARTPEPVISAPVTTERVQSGEKQNQSGGVFVVPFDGAFADLVEEAQHIIEPLPSSWHQAVTLAQFVSDKMGGSIDRDQLTSVPFELPLSQLKVDFESNVIPIGFVGLGVHQHRALLYKALADRISLPVSLVRGQYNRYANIVELVDDVDGSTGGASTVGQVIPPKPYLVDLLHQPGRLMKLESIEAIEYMKL